jgi:MATE family multidrug resistance protein
MLEFLTEPDDLAGAGMAGTFVNVTGFSLLIGFGSALTPLASQAYGARNPRRAGDLLQRQMLMQVRLDICWC